MSSTFCRPAQEHLFISSQGYLAPCCFIKDAKDRLSNPPACSDEVDRAQHEIDSMLFLRIVERESKLLPKIDKALLRIKAGDYGYCVETGDPIGLPRLISRPTAEFCAEVKTINEEKEKHFAD